MTSWARPQNGLYVEARVEQLSGGAQGEVEHRLHPDAKGEGKRGHRHQRQADPDRVPRTVAIPVMRRVSAG